MALENLDNPTYEDRLKLCRELRVPGDQLTCYGLDIIPHFDHARFSVLTYMDTGRKSSEYVVKCYGYAKDRYGKDLKICDIRYGLGEFKAMVEIVPYMKWEAILEILRYNLKCKYNNHGEEEKLRDYQS